MAKLNTKPRTNFSKSWESYAAYQLWQADLIAKCVGGGLVLGLVMGAAVTWWVMNGR